METSYLIKLLKEISDIMAENKDKLIEMDGIVGDGDLGLTMSDGFKAAYDAVSDGAIADAGKLLFAAGKAMANKVPSTMGSLNRENILLTILGTIAGIILGIILHKYVIFTTEVDLIMFGRQIYVQSYIYSILLTIAFSILVNAFVYFQLKKIDMVESLKSTE